MTRTPVALVLLFMLASPARGQDTSMTGLWYAKRWFGPELSGEFLIKRAGDRWTASIASRTEPAHVGRDSVHVDFPSGGTFRGRLAADGASITGHWIQPRTMLTGRRHATPIVLASCGPGCYSGRAEPLQDAFTIYMEVKRRGDGKLGAFLRNPERNLGRLVRADHMVRVGDSVFLRDARDSVIARSALTYGRFSMAFRNATFDFRKLPPDSFAHFFPRGKPGVTYTYAPPRALRDGWQVARAEEVGMSSVKLAAMIQGIIGEVADSANAFRLHGILIARHGKLVLEEYFFGEHADKPHETRSGSKTVLPVVMGAAMHASMRVSPATPAFATLGDMSSSLDPRKRAMTLEHLLTMSSGLDCDDSGDPRPGNEDAVTEQDTNPDWTRMILGLQVIRPPGESGVYCSINSYLGGEVVRRATGRWLPELIWELVARPMQMGRYHVQLSPLGEAYLGGGAYFLPRDYLKLAQLYLNGGTWNGRRLVSEAWVRESVQPRYRIGRTVTANNYGYQWWTIEFPYQARRVRAHYAAGNGGQYSLYIPELGLVIAAFGGNYSDPGGTLLLRHIIPQQILPAIQR